MYVCVCTRAEIEILLVCVVKRIILTQGDSANWLILCHGHQFLIPLTSHQRVLHHRPK